MAKKLYNREKILANSHLTWTELMFILDTPSDSTFRKFFKDPKSVSENMRDQCSRRVEVFVLMDIVIDECEDGNWMLTGAEFPEPVFSKSRYSLLRVAKWCEQYIVQYNCGK